MAILNFKDMANPCFLFSPARVERLGDEALHRILA
jgi:hypothetical protein